MPRPTIFYYNFNQINSFWFCSIYEVRKSIKLVVFSYFKNYFSLNLVNQMYSSFENLHLMHRIEQQYGFGHKSCHSSLDSPGELTIKYIERETQWLIIKVRVESHYVNRCVHSIVRSIRYEMTHWSHSSKIWFQSLKFHNVNQCPLFKTSSYRWVPQFFKSSQVLIYDSFFEHKFQY